MTPPAPMSPRPALTNLQRELLTLFATDLPDEDLREVKRLLARHFAEKATAAFERFAEERGLSPEDTDRWAYEHHRAAADRGGAEAAGDGSPAGA